MLSDKMLSLLRQWWKARRGYDTHLLPLPERFLLTGRNLDANDGPPAEPLFRETAEAAGSKKGAAQPGEAGI
jgi:hypothetical protein